MRPHWRRLAAAVGLTCLAWGVFTHDARAEETNYVGQTPPEITVKGFINGSSEMPKTLEGLRGRVVLLEFWATWCPPCRETIPHIKQLFEKYSSRGLQIISVSPEDPETVKPFVRENEMTYTIGLDDNKQTVHAYGIKSIPMAYLIGRDGKVIWQGRPVQLKEGQIEEALQTVEKK